LLQDDEKTYLTRSRVYGEGKVRIG